MKLKKYLSLALVLAFLLTTGCAKNENSKSNSENQDVKQGVSNSKTEIDDKVEAEKETKTEATKENLATENTVSDIKSNEKTLSEQNSNNTVNDTTVSNSTEQSNQDTTVSQSNITSDTAKNKAFSHAGVSASNAFDVDIESDYENGVAVYEIEFETTGAEYEYVINAKTGAIVRSFKKEKKQQTTIQITEETAKNKVFAHAGVSAAEVKELSVELEDDGVASYEIEFRVDQYEYEYVINAEDGSVIKSEKDFDD